MAHRKVKLWHIDRDRSCVINSGVLYQPCRRHLLFLFFPFILWIRYGRSTFAFHLRIAHISSRHLDSIRYGREKSETARRGAWFIRARRKSFIPQLSSRENILIRPTEFNSRSISAAVISRAWFLSFSFYLSRSPFSFHWKYFSYLSSGCLVSLRSDALFSYAFIEFIISVHHYSLHYRNRFCRLISIHSLFLSFAYFRHRNIRRHLLQR